MDFTFLPKEIHNISQINTGEDVVEHRQNVIDNQLDIIQNQRDSAVGIYRGSILLISVISSVAGYISYNPGIGSILQEIETESELVISGGILAITLFVFLLFFAAHSIHKSLKIINGNEYWEINTDQYWGVRENEISGDKLREDLIEQQGSVIRNLSEHIDKNEEYLADISRIGRLVITSVATPIVIIILLRMANDLGIIGEYWYIVLTFLSAIFLPSIIFGIYSNLRLIYNQIT